MRMRRLSSSPGCWAGTPLGSTSERNKEDQVAKTPETPTSANRRGTGAPRCRRLFTFQQAVDHAGMPPEMVWDAIRTGDLKILCLAGEVRIDEADLDEYVASRELKWL